MFFRKQDPLLIPRHLPIGRSEFKEWSDRIIGLAELTADKESQTFALADSLLHLPPGKSMEADGYFVHLLRKFAINETAVAMRKELYDAKQAAEEVAKKVEEDAKATLERIEQSK